MRLDFKGGFVVTENQPIVTMVCRLRFECQWQIWVLNTIAGKGNLFEESFRIRMSGRKFHSMDFTMIG
jgi:hypothetical protein